MSEVAVPSKVPTPPSQGAPRRDKILALNEEKGIYKVTVKYYAQFVGPGPMIELISLLDANACLHLCCSRTTKAVF